MCSHTVPGHDNRRTSWGWLLRRKNSWPCGPRDLVRHFLLSSQTSTVSIRLAQQFTVGTAALVGGPAKGELVRRQDQRLLQFRASREVANKDHVHPHGRLYF